MELEKLIPGYISKIACYLVPRLTCYVAKELHRIQRWFSTSFVSLHDTNASKVKRDISKSQQRTPTSFDTYNQNKE